MAFGFKGGIGTSSRRLPPKLGWYTVGVLVQTNFGGVLIIAGAPVGRELGRYYLREELQGGSATDRGNGSIPRGRISRLNSQGAGHWRRSRIGNSMDVSALV